MKIGVLGGTFDPIHRGHIMVAEEIRARLNLAEVLFVPTAQTPLKEDSPILAVEHRVQMVSLAIADYPYLKLSDVEINRAGLSYTIGTKKDCYRFGEVQPLSSIVSSEPLDLDGF